VPDHSDLLERMLRDAGAEFRQRPTPDVTAAVRARLDEPLSEPQRAPKWRVVIAAVFAAIALALIPGVRTAVADLLDEIPGIRLNFERGVSEPARTPRATAPGQSLGAPLGLLHPIDLATAQAKVPYDIPLPAELDPPDEVYVREGIMTMLWGATPTLPALGDSEVGLIIDVVDGSRGPVFEKLLMGVHVDWLEIDGEPAAWVAEPHPLVVVNAEGIPDRELERTAARTLLLSGPVSIRLESMLTRPEAIALAESLG
jgi:hypothetical protein